MIFPKILSAPMLPVLNHFQMNAVKKALQAPLCLIQVCINLEIT